MDPLPHFVPFGQITLDMQRYLSFLSARHIGGHTGVDADVREKGLGDAQCTFWGDDTPRSKLL